ncbi:hypothetical protein CIHG_03480 [Coccidioides immitis H538.4]|uniref:Uncharacterized protein n=2 Tax=Coccidioides immitis TaxID=5501 RepID=A0A0J8QUB6_COCIT|nr:hypothetical protein CISG_04815 [Coccidioides immitis RMSCC 3703]KMU85949.1 hypothetical protein CIHG_03480 [Coccidioides immitis H538.4]
MLLRVDGRGRTEWGRRVEKIMGRCGSGRDEGDNARAIPPYFLEKTPPWKGTKPCRPPEDCAPGQNLAVCTPYGPVSTPYFRTLNEKSGRQLFSLTKRRGVCWTTRLRNYAEIAGLNPVVVPSVPLPPPSCAGNKQITPVWKGGSGMPGLRPN